MPLIALKIHYLILILKSIKAYGAILKIFRINFKSILELLLSKFPNIVIDIPKNHIHLILFMSCPSSYTVSAFLKSFSYISTCFIFLGGHSYLLSSLNGFPQKHDKKKGYNQEEIDKLDVS